MIKCIIFDCDGTLVDSELLCNLGLEIKLREYKVFTSANNLMKAHRGEKLATTLQAIEQEHKISLQENFVEQYRELVEALIERELTACKGVVDFLNHNQLAVCVASNAPLKKISKALELTKLDKFFGNNIFSAYDINSWKPEPDIFIYAANQVKYHPSECLVIEDSETGVRAGLAANMKTILFDPKNLLHNMKGTTRINNLSELSQIIAF